MWLVIKAPIPIIIILKIYLIRGIFSLEKWMGKEIEKAPFGPMNIILFVLRAFQVGPRINK